MLLPKKFYSRDTVTMAKALIGTVLVHDSKQGRTAGRIVETEAYLHADDEACHAARGKTERNAVMFGPPGHVYVYLIYGMYECFNVVTQPPGSAVLVRALEPVEGIALMQKRRNSDDLHQLCSGPGKLVMAMGITRKLNGVPLTEGALTLWSRDSFGGSPAKPQIVTTPRIGINVSADLPLRFYLKASHFASRRCKFAPRRKRS